jgi:hypothetical protein
MRVPLPERRIRPDAVRPECASIGLCVRESNHGCDLSDAASPDAGGVRFRASCVRIEARWAGLSDGLAICPGFVPFFRKGHSGGRLYVPAMQKAVAAARLSDYTGASAGAAPFV